MRKSLHFFISSPLLLHPNILFGTVTAAAVFIFFHSPSFLLHPSLSKPLEARRSIRRFFTLLGPSVCTCGVRHSFTTRRQPRYLSINPSLTDCVQLTTLPTKHSILHDPIKNEADTRHCTESQSCETVGSQTTQSADNLTAYVPLDRTSISLLLNPTSNRLSSIQTTESCRWQELSPSA